jgi:hypothetical protein
MTALPAFAIATIVDNQITLRVYAGDQLEAEIPLRRHQALLLAAQLLNLALLPVYDAANQGMLETSGEQDVAVTEESIRDG